MQKIKIKILEKKCEIRSVRETLPLFREPEDKVRFTESFTVCNNGFLCDLKKSGFLYRLIISYFSLKLEFCLRCLNLSILQWAKTCRQATNMGK